MSDLITAIGIMRGECDPDCEGLHCYYHYDEIYVTEGDK